MEAYPTELQLDHSWMWKQQSKCFVATAKDRYACPMAFLYSFCCRFWQLGECVLPGVLDAFCHNQKYAWGIEDIIINWNQIEPTDLLKIMQAFFEHACKEHLNVVIVVIDKSCRWCDNDSPEVKKIL